MADDKVEGAEAQNGYIFALDIGTRSVIGIVGKQEGDLFHVVDAETREHTKRAMIDGQIEDIAQVAQVAGMVKERLEQRLGMPLTRVCVAAAGRSLKTSRASFELELSGTENVTAQTVYELEMGAVSAARELLDASENNAVQYYCVGYAVVRYFLDEYPFATILDHKGHTARAEVIATFLPNEVVDSLCAAMSMIHLDIDHLTLEPIAAMNAVIPTDLRLLNLALVDIGAGTSDIAISDSGSVSAYTMATVAGDEITEEIIQHCLVDFQTAETMKHAAARGDAQISYRDILGLDYSLKLEELLDILRPAVENLSHIICERILEANGKPPAAVFLVGGGSKAPLLCEQVADGLGIDRRKVAVGGNNFIQRVVRSELSLSGPEYATPMGIALTGAAAGVQERFFVYINGNKARLFRNHAVAVMDVLLMSGYQYSQLMGKSGKNVAYTLNGEKKTVRGGLYQPARIQINGEPAGITSPVACGDHVEVVPAVQGEDAQMFVSDLVDSVHEITVSLDGVLLDAGRRVMINGQPVLPVQEIHEQDAVELTVLCTLADLCAQTGIDLESSAFLVNGAEQSLDYELRDGDEIFCIPASGRAAAEEKEQDVLLEPPVPEAAIPILAPVPVMRAEPEVPPEEKVPLHFTGKKLHITVNGMPHALPRKESGMSYQFVDMLNLVDIDPTKPQGNIVLRLNGRDASYLETIGEGDQIDIYWDGR